MKKGLIITGIVILVLALLLGMLNLTVQRRATRAMNEGLQHSIKAVVQNPQNMTVTNAPIQFGTETSRIPEVQITGKALETKQDITVQSAKVVIKDVEVTNKTRKVTHIGESTYEVTFAAADLTKYYRTQPSQEIGGLAVNPASVTITLSKQGGIGLAGEGTEKNSTTIVPFSLHGTLTADPSGSGKFTLKDIEVGGRTVGQTCRRRADCPAGQCAAGEAARQGYGNRHRRRRHYLQRHAGRLGVSAEGDPPGERTIRGSIRRPGPVLRRRHVRGAVPAVGAIPDQALQTLPLEAETHPRPGHRHRRAGAAAGEGRLPGHRGGYRPAHDRHRPPEGFPSKPPRQRFCARTPPNCTCPGSSTWRSACSTA